MDKKRKAGHPQKSGILKMVAARFGSKQNFNFIVETLDPEERALALWTAAIQKSETAAKTESTSKT